MTGLINASYGGYMAPINSNPDQWKELVDSPKKDQEAFLAKQKQDLEKLEYQLKALSDFYKEVAQVKSEIANKAKEVSKQQTEAEKLLRDLNQRADQFAEVPAGEAPAIGDVAPNVPIAPPLLDIPSAPPIAPPLSPSLSSVSEKGGSKSLQEALKSGVKLKKRAPVAEKPPPGGDEGMGGVISQLQARLASGNKPGQAPGKTHPQSSTPLKPKRSDFERSCEATANTIKRTEKQIQEIIRNIYNFDPNLSKEIHPANKAVKPKAAQELTSKLDIATAHLKKQVTRLQQLDEEYPVPAAPIVVPSEVTMTPDISVDGGDIPPPPPLESFEPPPPPPFMPEPSTPVARSMPKAAPQVPTQPAVDPKAQLAAELAQRLARRRTDIDSDNEEEEEEEEDKELSAQQEAQRAKMALEKQKNEEEIRRKREEALRLLEQSKEDDPTLIQSSENELGNQLQSIDKQLKKIEDAEDKIQLLEAGLKKMKAPAPAQIASPPSPIEAPISPMSSLSPPELVLSEVPMASLQEKPAESEPSPLEPSREKEIAQSPTPNTLSEKFAKKLKTPVADKPENIPHIAKDKTIIIDKREKPKKIDGIYFKDNVLRDINVVKNIIKSYGKNEKTIIENLQKEYNLRRSSGIRGKLKQLQSQHTSDEYSKVRTKQIEALGNIMAKLQDDPYLNVHEKGIILHGALQNIKDDINQFEKSRFAMKSSLLELCDNMQTALKDKGGIHPAELEMEKRLYDVYRINGAERFREVIKAAPKEKFFPKP